MTAQCIRFMLAFLAAPLLAPNADASEISRLIGGPCVLKISGELVQGDYERFAALATATYPENVEESTAENTVCLDSPGGSLSEGVKFARHFYKKGVGTVIEDGASCYSACAIMFMMGTAQGPEVAFVSRKLHARGTLGFHRPYLVIEPGPQVDAAELIVAYDGAFQSALDLIGMANAKSPWTNTPMMKSDLVEAMLSHIGNDMFLIDTVDKVARFDVEPFGFSLPGAFGEAEAFYACQNALQWRKGLTTEDITYTGEVAEIYGNRRVKEIDRFEDSSVYQITGLASGYANEGCVVYRDKDMIKACGLDEYTMTQIGGGECGRTDYRQKSEAVNELAIINPSTKLADLPTAAELPAATRVAAVTAPATTAASPENARCYVRDGYVVEDDEPCRPITGSTHEGHETVSFVCPSGGKIVLVMQKSGPEINGVATSMVERKGFGRCYPNSRTGKEFCVSFSK